MSILNYTGPPPQPVWAPYVRISGVRIGLVMYGANVTFFQSIASGTDLGEVFGSLNSMKPPGGLTNIYQ